MNKVVYSLYNVGMTSSLYTCYLVVSLISFKRSLKTHLFQLEYNIV